MENLDAKLDPSSAALSEAPKNSKFSKFLPFIILVILISAGILTGLVLSSRNKNKVIQQSAALDESKMNPQQKKAVQVVTRDSAEGTIQKNDQFEKTAQGQWKLIRPGGDSQTAYLTSSFMDLDQYVGKKVKVYGETLGSDKVGWLMDVARVEVK